EITRDLTTDDWLIDHNQPEKHNNENEHEFSARAPDIAHLRQSSPVNEIPGKFAEWCGWRLGRRTSGRFAAAELTRVVDEAVDVRVGEVGGFHAAGFAAFGQQERDTAFFGADPGGVVASCGPATAEDDVRRAVGGASEGQAVAEQIPQAGGDDVGRRSLGSGHDDDPGSPAPGHQITNETDELVLLLFGAVGRGVEREFIDNEHDHVNWVVASDLAAFDPPQLDVTAVHL